MKRITAVLMAAFLAATALAGCKAAAGGDTTAGGSAMGRYVEEDMELPMKSGEYPISLGKSEAGNLLLFASDAGGGQVIRYEYGEGKWDRLALEWTKDLITNDMVTFDDAEEADDGTIYVLSTDNISGLRTVTKKTADGDAQKADIPWLEQEKSGGFFPMVYDLLVDGAGHYWLMDVLNGSVVVYDSEQGDIVKEIPVSQNGATTQKVLFRNENGEIAVTVEQGRYAIYDEDSLESAGTLESKAAEGTQYALCGDGENWYQFSESGIARMKAGNDIEENIMDGSSSAMGSPVNTLLGAQAGQDGEFYALYKQSDAGTYSLEHYVYDEEIAAVPEHTLKVFGLEKSDTVQQAVTQFQKANPDVKVEYTTLGKDADEVTTDDIRTLNTELLSGNGADVLMLDGLSLDSYIEKGILEDITDIAQEFADSGEYMDNFIESAAASDGKIYGLPVKFSVPLMFGEDEAKQALEDMDSLKAYLEASPDSQVFCYSDPAYVRDVLFLLYQDEIIGEDGRVDQEKLTELFEMESAIIKNMGEDGELPIFVSGDDALQGQVSAFGEGGDGVGVLEKKDTVGTADVKSLAAMMMPYGVMREAKTQADPVHGLYNPQGIAGINHASGQKELAKEFVRFLLSEEIQDVPLYDGFPVLTSALEAKAEESEEGADSFAAGISVSDDSGSESMLTVGYPTREETEDFIELCKTLDKPLVQNRIIWNFYTEEADNYLEGSVSADEAAKNIAQKVDTYLAE